MAGAGQLANMGGCYDWTEEPVFSARSKRAGGGRPSEPGLSRLAETIEVEIIPRLMLAHGTVRAPVARSPDEPVPSQEEIREFARLVLDHDVAVASSYVEVMRSRGVSIETLLLQVLAPTARLLGDLWKEDLCSFAEVTVGLSRMQHMLRELGSRIGSEFDETGHGGRALLATAPGEQHSFGMVMVEEFFRRAGWAVRGGAPKSAHDLTALVRTEWFDVVGLSASCDLLFDQLASAIQAVRRASRNRHVGVLVGGRLFLDHPELVAQVGADASALDGRQAVQMLPRLLETKVARS